MNVITKLSIRQKVMLTLTILASLFLVWQIYTFVHGPAVARFNDSGIPQPEITAPPATAPVPKPVSQLSSSQRMTPALAEQQRQYLDLVRQYQVTKMQRQILDEQAGVANAKKRIVEANNGHGYDAGSLLEGETVSGSNYQLAYLDRQAGQWTAALNVDGQYQEVRKGTRLANGSRITAINRAGVTIRSAQGQVKVLSFQGTENVDDQSVYTVSSAKKKAPVVSHINSAENAKNHKIAKILGITATPAPAQTAVINQPVSAPAAPAPVVQPSVSAPTAAVTVQPAVVAPAPVVSSTDIPAAPLTEESAPAPAVVNEATSAAPAASVPADDASETPAPKAMVKPVSVKELREHNINTQAPAKVPAPIALESENPPKHTATVNQISWQQAADLQAAILNNDR